MITGSDVAGEVREAGKDVVGRKAGDRVLVDPVQWDAARPGMIGETSHGGRAELLSVHASQLIRMPDNVEFEAAASLPLAYGTADRMMVARGRVASGEKVLVLGASGGVGTAWVLLAKLAGAEVLACASSAATLERLRALGSDHLIDHREPRTITPAMRVVFVMSSSGLPARSTKSAAFPTSMVPASCRCRNSAGFRVAATRASKGVRPAATRFSSSR